jgi:hypothetical protein
VYRLHSPGHYAAASERHGSTDFRVEERCHISTLKIERAHSSETSGNVYQTTRHRIPDDSDLDSRSNGKLRSNKNVKFQAVNRRRLAAESRCQSQSRPCGICGVQSGTGTSCISASPLSIIGCGSVNAQYSF